MQSGAYFSSVLPAFQSSKGKGGSCQTGSGGRRVGER